MKMWANILLAVWLIATGLVSLLGLHFANSGTILAILAIAAGVLMLLAGRGSQTGRLGTLLLAVWLIATGLIALTRFSFKGIDLVMAILAIAAGLLILLKR